jgi:hypothetical protein
MHPKARANSLIVQHLDDETLVYDKKKDKAHCLNPTSAFVWRHCDGKTSVDDLTALLRAEFGSGVDEGVVRLSLDQLSKAELLTGVGVPISKGAGLSRRDVAKRLGLAATAAFALPTVLSIVAPRAVDAATNCITCNGSKNTNCNGNAGRCCVTNGGAIGTCTIPAPGNCVNTGADCKCC